jgi:hypothetical protein
MARGFLRSGVMVVVAVSAALALTPAEASASWLASANLGRWDIGEGGVVEGQGPRVAMSASGEAVAVWESECRIVASISASPGQAWQGPVAISGPGQCPRDPRVAIDVRGDIVAAWNGRGIESAFKPAHSVAWQPPVIVSGGSDYTGVSIAIDAHGNAIATWVADLHTTYYEESHGSGAEGEGGVVESSVRPMRTGVWSRPIKLSRVGEEVPHRAVERLSTNPEVALDARGDAVVVWNQATVRRSHGGDGGERVQETTVVQAAVRSALTRKWQPSANVSRLLGVSEVYPQLAVDPQGDAVVAWSVPGGIELAVRSAINGVWHAPRNVARGRGPSKPEVIINSYGEIVAIRPRARELPGLDNVVDVAIRHAHGGIARLAVDLGRGTLEGARVAVGSDGSEVAVSEEEATYKASEGPPSVSAEAYIRPPGGAWRRPVDISLGTSRALASHVAIDAHGDATVVWVAASNTATLDSIVQSVTYLAPR